MGGAGISHERIEQRAIIPSCWFHHIGRVHQRGYEKSRPAVASVPHMLVVTFVVMLPILGMTKDPVQAWEAGLTWVFVQSFVLMIGCFIGPVVRRITPRGRCSARSPAFRSPSSQCGPACRCSRRR
jgi:hypothetical protein